MPTRTVQLILCIDTVQQSPAISRTSHLPVSRHPPNVTQLQYLHQNLYLSISLSLYLLLCNTTIDLQCTLACVEDCLWKLAITGTHLCSARCRAQGLAVSDCFVFKSLAWQSVESKLLSPLFPLCGHILFHLPPPPQTNRSTNSGLLSTFLPTYPLLLAVLLNRHCTIIRIPFCALSSSSSRPSGCGGTRHTFTHKQTNRQTVREDDTTTGDQRQTHLFPFVCTTSFFDASNTSLCIIIDYWLFIPMVVRHHHCCTPSPLAVVIACARAFIYYDLLFSSFSFLTTSCRLITPTLHTTTS